jgi:hypothetical protein
MKEERFYYTARHLLVALQNLDEDFLDLPLILAHGKGLQKPNLVQGFVPAPTAVNRKAVESKRPSLLMLGELTDALSVKAKPGKAKNGKNARAASAEETKAKTPPKSAKVKNGKRHKKPRAKSSSAEQRASKP